MALNLIAGSIMAGALLAYGAALGIATIVCSRNDRRQR
ncbi:hypothetical protein G1C96_1616 [Bifidobacterium sp. DSM 109958]|uniref:Uncharacterized protein n=1 Tax=Bifidobacterium moraviense TaxID=2675323 RepID=A0A7Y0F2W5_9BIFI|nr:hypothetical protein [Bifidobacterium sp. DSM 109958]